MSTSDQDGNRQLTRKQLREIRLTGSTPVISEEEAASAAQPAPVLPRAAEPITIEPAPEPVPEDAEGAPLTRRQARELERSRTASVPVVDEQPGEDADEAPVTAETAIVDSGAPSQAAGEAPEEPTHPAIVSEVPRFDAPASEAAPIAETGSDFGVADRGEPADTDADIEPEESSSVADAPRPAVFQPVSAADTTSAEAEPADAPEPAQPAAPASADSEPEPERPMVGAAFGLGVKSGDSAPHVPSRFDSILDGESGGSHPATNALIFTHTPGIGSLSGPVAATGELLITGTYELPEGLGSQGHALGVADGKDVDAVLIDGELAPASSPTPIAASSAVSTSKPAGEVIRPPAPEKGSKLMLTLAVVAGGLALALATVLIIAFTTNLFGG